MKILLIEDHDFQRHILLTQLNQIIVQSTDEVIGAASGIEALSLMDGFQPDVLICDLNMPGMDGITFLSRIAEQDFSGFIIITSATSPKVINAVSKMCASYDLNLLGSLIKPAKMNVMADLLEHARQHQSLSIEMESHSSLCTEKLSLTTIQQALDQQWLTPYFQPLVKLETGEWVGCEALIRLEHPTLGVISPCRFLPQLSAMGKDAELAILSIHYIIDHQKQLCQRKVAVNIAPDTLVLDGFVDQVLMLTSKHHSLSSHLYFEITESNALEDTGRALEAASRLGMHGFKLSIDDFGTGYSSLKQLEILPFESLKLDMSFIQALPTSRTAHAIVESSLLLTQRLGLTSVAEGIENQSLWHQLQQLNCNIAQGYFIAEPMHANMLSTWHNEWKHKVRHLNLDLLRTTEC